MSMEDMMANENKKVTNTMVTILVTFEDGTT